MGEDVEMTNDALSLLTRIGQDTTLRYAIHMITTAALVCAKRQGTEVGIEVLRKCTRYSWTSSALSRCWKIITKTLCSTRAAQTWKKMKMTKLRMRSKVSRRIRTTIMITLTFN